MRLLLDEHFSPRIATQLRLRGRDVIAARTEPKLHGVSDEQLLALATEQQRVVVTENVADFVELHRATIVSGRRHFGLIFTSPRRFPRTARGIGRIVRALAALMDARHPDDVLVNQTWWLEP